MSRPGATSAGPARRASGCGPVSSPGTGERLACHVLSRQPYHVGAQLLQRGVADTALLRFFGALAAFMRCHENLSLNHGIAHNGLLSSTVSEGAGC